ncbi:MAG TPA: hypothetical protein VG186_13675 [Solirubrobacteraceae bacterium]|nr:hypothetical protein [Solirubrobacteraceae bacterium]
MTASVSAAKAQGLTLGFDNDPVLTSGSSASQALWLGRAVAEGAGIARISVGWASVAPAVRPPGFSPASPSSPGYDWTATDAAVRELSSQGLRVLLNFVYAPGWAEGPHRPASAQPGSWRPDPTQFARFATAAALRYDGHFPDPLHPGSFLPRVRLWQPWNEPNLNGYLTPQWTRSGSGWAPASPAIYRKLLNSFYAAVKAVSASNFVVTAGTGPYGDPPGGARMPPVQFDRGLFCLNARLSPTGCSNPPHLDALDHHPYGIQGPLWHALNPDDAAVPDIYKIARVLHAAQRYGHVLPRGPKSLWATEISWDSNPPDPRGVPIQKQARWLEQALYVLWRQGVDTVLWLQVADSPPIPNYGASYQAGLFYLNGKSKPAAQAYRFPFVTQRANSSRVKAWGLAPQTGSLAIEKLSGGQWKLVRRLSVSNRQVFQTTLTIRGRAVLRAQLGSETSLTWTQGA